jgi:hypothetical protein
MGSGWASGVNLTALTAGLGGTMLAETTRNIEFTAVRCPFEEASTP